MKTNLLYFITFIVFVGGLFLTNSCSDDLEIENDYGFTVTYLPVPKRLKTGETAEIRFELVRAGKYANAKYYVRYFQYDGKGDLTLEGRPLTPNDGYELRNETFRMYYTSQCEERQLFDVCLEHLKKYEREGRDPFLLFGNMAEALITTEMAQLVVRLEPSCIQFVPDRLKTPEMCAEAIEKDWMNMRFIPERMKTKEICDIAMKRSIHAQQLVPERFKTPEMYMQHVKADGLKLEYVQQ